MRTPQRILSHTHFLPAFQTAIMSGDSWLRGRGREASQSDRKLLFKALLCRAVSYLLAVFWQRRLSIILAVFLAGCVRYEPQPLRPQQLESAFRARTLADAGLRQFVETNFISRSVAWPPAAFDLKSLTLAALYFHPDLQLAGARVATAQAAEITAGRGLIRRRRFCQPGIQFVPRRNALVVRGQRRCADRDGGQTPSPRRTGARADGGRPAGLFGIGLERSLPAAQALVEYFCAQRALELYQAEAQTQSQLTNLLQQRVQAGETSRFELTLARTQSLNAAIALRAAQTRLATRGRA